MPQAKKIILLGKEGQLGFSLQRALSIVGELHAFNRAECDVSDKDKLKQIIQQLSPDVIVNAAAYTAVDKAETDSEQAFRINAQGPGILAELAKTQGAILVHYSTDYVFDGSKSTPYQEDDIPSPINQYGASKLAGEKAIAAVGGQYWILRTSWVYSQYGQNFLKTILRLAQTRTELTVVDDQYGVPTSADLLADVTMQMLQRAWLQSDVQSGLYHLVPAGKTSWFEFAKFILATARGLGVVNQLLEEKLTAIPATAYSLPAARPYNSCLKNDKIQQEFNVVLPHWQKHVEHALIQLLKNR
jgi:dTDP-4-dehydrorhamnose reductase